MKVSSNNNDYMEQVQSGKIISEKLLENINNELFHQYLK